MKKCFGKKVMVFGTFDLLHPGHENFFKQARQRGDCIIAVLARQVTLKVTKKQKAVFSEKERVKNLLQKKWADLVILGSTEKYYDQIFKIKPDVICLGYDQKYFVNKLASELKNRGLNTKIVRLKPFKQQLYKSSIIRKKIYA